MLKLVGPLTSKTFSGALIMPNLQPPITSKVTLSSYMFGDEKVVPLFAGHALSWSID